MELSALNNSNSTGRPVPSMELVGYIENNRATLRYISLAGIFSPGNKKLEKLLQLLLKLPALEELYVDCQISEDILANLLSIGVYWNPQV